MSLARAPTASVPGRGPGLFPLPLTPFERFFLVEQAGLVSAHSLSVYEFEGALDREALERTLPGTLARHPLLVARIDPGHRTWLDPSEASLPRLEWTAAEEAGAGPGPAGIDLVREPGIRLRARATQGGTRLEIENHHSCTDGVGKLQFVADWMLAYAARVTGQGEPEWVPTSLASLAGRGRLEPAVRARDPHPRSGPGWFESLGEILAYLRVSPEPLRGSVPGDPGGNPASGLVVRVLEATVVQGLAARAKASAATLNDLVLAVVLSWMADWNRARGAGERSWVQLAVPANYRTPEDSAAPASNRVGMDFRERRLRDCRDLPALLVSVAAESRRARDRGTGLLLPRVLAFGFSIPGLVELYSRLDSGTPTGVVSNLGRVEPVMAARGRRGLAPLEEAGCRLRGVSFASPLRPGTRVSLGLATVGGVTHLAGRFDRRHFPESLREEFMDGLASRLGACVAAG